MRFIIISVLPEPFHSIVRDLRSRWNKITGSKESLRYPPHLTLRTGLVVPDTLMDQAAQAFLSFARTFSAVQASTQGVFAATLGQDGASCSFVGFDVEPNGELLALHRGLLQFSEWKKGPQQPYQPHLSLAYGDLDLEGLRILRSEISRRPPDDFSWWIDHVALYYEKETEWVEYARSPLLASKYSLQTEC